MKKIEYLTNAEKAYLVKAILKAASHALISPLLIFMLVNITVSGNYGGVFAVLWLFLVGLYYNNAKNRDVSKMTFNYIVGTLSGIFIGIAFLGLIFSVV